MEIHLSSIVKKDIELMKTTLPQSGDLYLTLPDGSMTTTVKEFVDGQGSWFKTDGWSFVNKIIKHEHGKQFGYVLVIADYKENDRGGKPYHHQMFVSYDLKKNNDKWIVVKDHASTIKKIH
jgi:ketosteroid isomerase-like protein